MTPEKWNSRPTPLLNQFLLCAPNFKTATIDSLPAIILKNWVLSALEQPHLFERYLTGEEVNKSITTLFEILYGSKWCTPLAQLKNAAGKQAGRYTPNEVFLQVLHFKLIRAFTSVSMTKYCENLRYDVYPKILSEHSKKVNDLDLEFHVDLIREVFGFEKVYFTTGVKNA